MKMKGKVVGINSKGYSQVELENNKKVEVLYGCPGDVVEVEKIGRKYFISQILSPSKHRAKVLCPHAGDRGKSIGRCGGCLFQFIDYKYQLQWKKDTVKTYLQERGIDIKDIDILPSPQVFQYRNRMDFAVDPNKKLGLRSKGSWKYIVPLTTCLIVSSEINTVREKISEWLAGSDIEGWNIIKHTGNLRYVVIRQSQSTGKLAAIFITKEQGFEKYKDELHSLLGNNVYIYNGINSEKADVSIVNNYQTIWGEDYLTEQIADISYLVSPGSFFQTNTKGAEKMIEIVLNWVQSIKPKYALDMYCGSGFFTLQLAKYSDKVIGVELDEKAIILAQKSLEINKIENAEFISLDATEYVKSYDENLNSLDLLLVDPPRTGLHNKVVEVILDKNPKYIIYISCNYKTLAQNLLQFKEKYSLEDIILLDMFPHTPHIETLVLLKSKAEI